MVHYTGYSFMVSGYNRLPIVTWLREQATEGLVHAQEAGEMITLVGGYPSLAIGELLDCRQHDTGRILRESLAAEGAAYPGGEVGDQRMARPSSAGTSSATR